MDLRALSAISVITMLVACSASAPKSRIVSHDPVLSRQGGVLLLVDVCVQRDALGDAGDYFVITEAKTGAQALLNVLHKYVQDSGIPIRAELIPFVCGARHNTRTIRVADSVNSLVRDAQQPLGISEVIRDDLQYINALTVMSTYAFERAAVSGVSSTPSPGNLPSGSATMNIGISEFRAAADVIKSRTQASSVLFLGVLGISRTAGKVIAQNIGDFIVSMGVGFATAGLGTGYYLLFIPGHQIDGRVMEGALVDLESGQLTWSNAVQARGDPIDPKVMANSETLNLLFRGLMFKPTSALPARSSNP
jgi:hypothetical protein